MDQINFFLKSFTLFVAMVLPLLFVGCGTTSSVKQSLAPVSSDLQLGGKRIMYSMGSCEVEDKRATTETCTEIQERVRYGLFIMGFYEKNAGKAPMEIDLTITNFRKTAVFTRASLGILSGQDGLDVKVDVVDRKDGKIIGSSDVSSFNMTALNITTQKMINDISNKVVEFLTTGTSE